MLHYRKQSSVCSGTVYEAWTLDPCTLDKSFVDLKSPTIQAVVAYAKKNGLTLQKHD